MELVLGCGMQAGKGFPESLEMGYEISNFQMQHDAADEKVGALSLNLNLYVAEPFSVDATERKLGE